MIEDWNFFMAVDSSGCWLVVNGKAKIIFADSGKISGDLRLGSSQDESVPVYAKVFGQLDNEGFVSLTVVSTSLGVPSFEINGPFLRSESEIESKTVVLTDGTTVLGLTHVWHSGSAGSVTSS